MRILKTVTVQDGLSYLNAEKPHLMEDTIRCGFSAVRNRTIRCGLTCPSIGIGYG